MSSSAPVSLRSSRCQGPRLCRDGHAIRLVASQAHLLALAVQLGVSVKGPKLCTGEEMGHTPSTAGTFRKKFRKDSGKTPETLSERFREFPSRVRLGCPKPYNSRHLRLPEHFQNYLPPNTAGGASFFRSGSGEGLPELVMEFPAVLGVFLKKALRKQTTIHDS